MIVVLCDALSQMSSLVGGYQMPWHCGIQGGDKHWVALLILEVMTYQMMFYF